MGRLLIGFDVGTQGTKGLVLDADRQTVVARASRAYGLIEGLPEGAAEQHPRTWIDAVRRVARDLLAEPEVDADGDAGADGGETPEPAAGWSSTMRPSANVSLPFPLRSRNSH